MNQNRKHSCFVFILWPYLRLCKVMFRPLRFYSLLRAVKDFQSYYDHLAKHNGRLMAAKQLKYVYGLSKRLALGCCLPRYEAPIWFTPTQVGFPKRLLRIQVLLLSNSFLSKRIALTIVNCFRLIDHKAEASYDSVLGVGSFKIDDFELIPFLKQLKYLKWYFRLSRIKPLRRFDIRSFYVGSVGPYGSRGSFAVGRDSAALLSAKYSPYLDSVKFLVSKYLDTPTFLRWMHNISVIPDFRPNTNPGPAKLARYVFISEGGGKSRGVTPVSSIIQGSLYPFHEYFMTILNCLPMDCSFDEAKGCRKVQEWTSRGLRLHSIDMTDATDRFPVEVASHVVAEFLGEEFSSHWLNLMRLPIVLGMRQKEHSFRVGAPMGIYCLWPVFTLAHHVMVQFSAFDVGRRGIYRDYVIRGDDIVIVDEDVASRYKILLGELGLKFSASKTYGLQGDPPGIAEFAKRLYLDGVDISPVSSKQLRAARSVDPFCSFSLLSHLVDGFQVDRTNPKEKLGFSLHSVLSSLVYTRFVPRLLDWASRVNVARGLPQVLGASVAYWSRFENEYPDLYERAVDDALGEVINGIKMSRDDIITLHQETWKYYFGLGIGPYLWDRHPVLRSTVEVNAKLVKLRRDGFFTHKPSYSVSKTLQMLHTMKGYIDSTRKTRRNVRLSIVSKYLPLLRKHVAKYDAITRFD